MKKFALVAVVAGLVAPAALGSGDTFPRPHGAFAPVAAHEVGGAPRVASATGTGPAIRYFQTSQFTVPANGYKEVSAACPQGFKVLSGQFATDGYIFPDFSAALNTRRWGFSLSDASGQQGKAAIGVVCSRGNG